MVEIEDREMTFRSWKAYSNFLKIEVRKLQQLLPTSDVANCYRGAKKDFEREQKYVKQKKGDQ